MRTAALLATLLACCALRSAAADWNSLPASVRGLMPSAPAVSSPVPLAASTRPVICVDPGHPNTFNAATTVQNGTTEVHINWLVGLKLRDLLQHAGYDVAMTKSAEMEYVENKDRARLCNASGAVLAVHLHCESTPGTGFALFYPDRVGTFEYNDDPENGFQGPSAEVRSASRELGNAVNEGMRSVLDGTLRAKGVFGDSRTAVGSRQGALTFSIFSEIPTLTIEMVVLSNPRDAAFIKKEEGRRTMAEAIAAGILRYRAP